MVQLDRTNRLFQEAATQALADPVLGNRWIANIYFELSDRLGRILHETAGADAPRNATFAAFAAWSADSLAVDVGRADGAADLADQRSLAIVDLEFAKIMIDEAAKIDEQPGFDDLFTAAFSAIYASDLLVDLSSEVNASQPTRTSIIDAHRALTRVAKTLARFHYSRTEPDTTEAVQLARQIKDDAATIKNQAEQLLEDVRSEGLGLHRRRDPRRPRGGPLWAFYRRLADSLVDDDSIAMNIAAGQGEVLVEIGQALNSFISMTQGRRLDDDWWQAFSSELLDQADERLAFSRTRAQASGVEPEEAFGPANVATLLEGIRPLYDLLLRDQEHFWDRDNVEPLSEKERAEFILLSNVRLVTYEQRRLQPLLERNLSFLRSALWRRTASRLSRLPRATTQAVLRDYDRIERLGSAATSASEILATRYAFNMIAGNETLAFGRDLPLPEPANALLRERSDNGPQFKADLLHYSEGLFFPDALLTIENQALWVEWQAHSRARAQGGGTAVNNWLRYEERVSYIVNFFRSRQQVSALHLGRKARRTLGTSAPNPRPQPPIDPLVPPSSDALAKSIADLNGLAGTAAEDTATLLATASSSLDELLKQLPDSWERIRGFDALDDDHKRESLTEIEALVRELRGQQQMAARVREEIVKDRDEKRRSVGSDNAASRNQLREIAAEIADDTDADGARAEAAARVFQALESWTPTQPPADDLAEPIDILSAALLQAQEQLEAIRRAVDYIVPARFRPAQSA